MIDVPMDPPAAYAALQDQLDLQTRTIAAQQQRIEDLERVVAELSALIGDGQPT